MDCNCPHARGIIARNMCGHDNTCPAYIRWAAANLQRLPATSAAVPCDSAPPELQLSAAERERLAIFFKDEAERRDRAAAEPEPDPLPPDAPRGERSKRPTNRRSYGGLKFRRL